MRARCHVHPHMPLRALLPMRDGLEISEFPVVDVSDEPFDGDPAHSDGSNVRGVRDVRAVPMPGALEPAVDGTKR